MPTLGLQEITLPSRRIQSAMNTGSETISLTGTLALIDLRGDGFDSALLFRGNPIALNWQDNAGSVGQYMARAGATNYEESLDELRHVLDDNLREDITISSQIHSFLDLFVPGQYSLHYEKGSTDYDLIEYNSTWTREKDFDGFYPFGDSLVFTQPSDLLNPDRIDHFVQAIRNGSRPIALTATVAQGWCEFVLDGHHKLQAYKIAQIPPAFVSICRIDAPRLLPNAFDDYFGEQHPMSSHFRKYHFK